MNDTAVDVSCIIPVHNHRTHLTRLLESLREGLTDAIRHEIIVADDASTEDLSGLCAEFGARHIRVEPNQGPANARNAGAAEAKGAVLLFFDADVVYASGAAEKAWRLLTQERPDAVAVSFMHQPFQPGDAAVANYQAATEHYWTSQLFDDPNQDVVEGCGFASRSGAVRREAYEAIRGFDPHYKTNAHEDYDFGKRIAAHGTVLVTRAPIIYHDYPARLARVIRNLWVRVHLFIPYVLTHKAGLFKIQISPKEGRIRLAGGFGFPAAAALALVPTPAQPVFAAAALACLAYYGAGVAPFLRRARAWSQSTVFTVQCALIHGATSAVINVASGLALLRFLMGQRAAPLRSPVH